MAMSLKKKDEEKEKKFLGLLAYKLDYDFEKNSVSQANSIYFSVENSITDFN